MSQSVSIFGIMLTRSHRSLMLVAPSWQALSNRTFGYLIAHRAPCSGPSFLLFFPVSLRKENQNRKAVEGMFGKHTGFSHQCPPRSRLTGFVFAHQIDQCCKIKEIQMLPTRSSRRTAAPFSFLLYASCCSRARESLGFCSSPLSLLWSCSSKRVGRAGVP